PSGKLDRKFSRSAVSGTRSWGRFGPATEGSTLARSSVRRSSKAGVWPGRRHRPWALAYASTSRIRSSDRPVRRRYAIVSSSIGKSVEVAPNSGLMFAIVARSARDRLASPSPANSTNAPTTPNARSIWVTTRTRSVAVEPDPDHARHCHVDRLAQERRLGLDAADAPGEDAEAVDHGRVRVRPDHRVGQGDRPAVLVGAVGDDRGQVLEVDLVDDARAGWHDPQVAERGLRPTQELIALAVALVLASDVE